MENKEVELGDRVKDKISGLAGVVIGITNWLYGCRRITIQPEAIKKDEQTPADGFVIDEPQCQLIKKGVVAGYQTATPPVAKQERTHGPRKDPSRY